MTKVRRRVDGTRRLLLYGVVAAVLGVTVVGWAIGSRISTGESARERIVHEEGAGPLAMYVDGGGSSITAPVLGEWWATHGWAHPCVEGVESATITAVRYQAVPKPLEIRTLFTFTPPYAERGEEWSGQFGDALGVYPEFDGQKLDPTNGGFASRDLPVVIDTPCAAHPAPRDGWVEMLTEVRVGRKGTNIQVAHIDYEVADRKFTLAYRWQMVMCGSAPEVIATDMCHQEDGREPRRWDEPGKNQ